MTKDLLKAQWRQAVVGCEIKTDKKKIIDGLVWFYGEIKMAPVPTYVLPSPYAVQICSNLLHNLKLVEDNDLIKQIMGKLHAGLEEEVTLQDWRNCRQVLLAALKVEHLQYFFYSSFFEFNNYNWIPDYDFDIQQGVDKNETRLRYIDIMKAGIYHIIPMPDFCCVCELPSEIHLDDRNDYHHATKPAIVWKDGYYHYYLHGLSLENWMVENPEKITVEIIKSQKNGEVRRYLYEQYGYKRYMEDCGAEIIDRYSGKLPGLQGAYLLREKVEGDEDIVMISLVNSTPNPDGSEKRYLERVPPTITTCLEAEAWGFSTTPENYERTEAES